MGCKAQTAAIPGGIARICNAADRPKPGCDSRERVVQRFLFIAAAFCAALFAGCTAPQRETAEVSRVPPSPAKRAAAVTSTSAAVQPWYLIHDEGEKPSRILYYAQEDWSRGRPSPRSANVQAAAADAPRNVNVEIVYESASEAAAVYEKLAVDCRGKNYQETMQRTLSRDNRSTRENKPSPPQPMTAAWQAQVYRFACGAVERRTIDNGFASLGTVADENLLDLSWKTAWQDGTLPPSATTRQRVPAAGGMTVAGNPVPGAATPQERLQKDAQAGMETYLAEIVEANHRRRAQTPNPKLETWIGATKGQLLQDWGRNYDLKTNETGDDLLTYVYDNSSAVVASSSHGPVISSVTHRCQITWQIRGGVVKTYRWKNEGGRKVNVCRSMNIDAGPFPEKESAPKADRSPAPSHAKRR
jgi:hypothetical protein